MESLDDPRWIAHHFHWRTQDLGWSTAGVDEQESRPGARRLYRTFQSWNTAEARAQEALGGAMYLYPFSLEKSMAGARAQGALGQVKCLYPSA